MNAFVEWVSQPWPWYVAGPIIGLMVPLHLILLNRTFGISSSFRHVCAACIPNNFEFLKYDWKGESWNLVFAGGILIGAFLAVTVFGSDEPIALSEAAVARMNEMGIQDLSDSTPKRCFLGRSLPIGGRCCLSLAAVSWLVLERDTQADAPQVTRSWG